MSRDGRSRSPAAAPGNPGTPGTPRVVITDVDGTLTDANRRMDLSSLAALQELNAAGVPVVFATGNVLPIVLGLHRFLGLRTPIIAENGGLVYFDEGRIVRLADRAVAMAALRQAQRTLSLKLLFTDRWRETEVAVEPTVPVSELERAVEGCGVRVEGTGFALHLFQPTAGKLPAARLVLEELKVPLKDCLFLGDGDNDVQLLRAVGTSATFPNASPAARAAAGHVTRASHGAGFVEALIRYGLLAPPGSPRSP